MKEIVDQAKSCTECNACMDVCPTYKVTDEVQFSPIGRLQAAIKVFEGDEVSERMIEGLNNCLSCTACDDVCPEGIKITEIVIKSRSKLVERGLGPLPGQNRIIEGILAKGNAVNGDPGKRLEWLPEEFPRRESDTLLYMGCIGSYVVKDAAASAYLVLKKLGFDFMLLEDEGCCGSFVYEAGKVDLAGELFQKNVERFKSLGIRRVIFLCPACLKCFKYSYPEVLGGIEFSVHHISEIIYDLVKENPSLLRKVQRTVTYQDPCELGRGEGVTEEPRKLLNWCGAELKEMENNRESAQCCGAGVVVMGVYRDLSMKVASGLLKMAETDSIVSACPFCTLTLNMASRAGELTRRTTYFTNILLDSMS